MPDAVARATTAKKITMIDNFEKKVGIFSSVVIKSYKYET